MKPASPKRFKILFAGLALAVSTLCFVFLNTSAGANSQPLSFKAAIENADEGEKKKMILPDIELLKKILQTGKRLFPAH